jgi:hypothetical protein
LPLKIFLSTVISLVPIQVQSRVPAKVSLIKNLPDGVYKAEIPLIHRSHNSADLYITFRKEGNHIIGIPSYSNSVSDYIPKYWERSCIEGDIQNNLIIGSGVIVENKEVLIKSGATSSNAEWFESYKVKMRNGKVYKSRPVAGNTEKFAVINIYRKAIGDFLTIQNVKNASNSKVPLSCKSLINDTFNKSFELYRN